MNAENILSFRLVESISEAETLLQLRNMAHVRKYMFHTNLIDYESHMRWFKSLNKKNNFYYIYSRNDEDIGVVNIKDVDWGAMEGEAGIFVSNEKYLGSHLNIAALLHIYGLAFNDMGLKKLKAYIRPDNLRALRLNIALGFARDDICDDRYILTVEKYNKKTIKFNDYINNLNKSIGKKNDE